MKGCGQGFLEGGADGGGASFLTSAEIGMGGGAEGTLFTVTTDVGMRGGGGGRLASGVGSAMCGQFLTFTIFRKFLKNNEKF